MGLNGCMNGYRLFVFDCGGRLIGPAVVVPATNDDEAIARAEAMRGRSAAELLDINRLRVVRYLGECRGVF
jgi:hypothetical protein